MKRAGGMCDVCTCKRSIYPIRSVASRSEKNVEDTTLCRRGSPDTDDTTKNGGRKRRECFLEVSGAMRDGSGSGTGGRIDNV